MCIKYVLVAHRIHHIQSRQQTEEKKILKKCSVVNRYNPRVLGIVKTQSDP